LDPILILGAGINGAAVAREFLLNRIPVVLVDTGDTASGTTAYSSRLIHGGLRYLEYAEFGLVRESLGERARLLRLAPQFVRQLRFHIPVSSFGGGLSNATRRFLGSSVPRSPQSRGLLVVRSGLWLYDWMVHGGQLPFSSARRVDPRRHPAVDADRFRWLCSYSDAQITYPERFVLALLKDAALLADEHEVEFQFFPYHRVFRRGGNVNITRGGSDVTGFRPTAIVNATGAWVDDTLKTIEVPASRLICGTKGSHLFSWQPRLQEILGGDAIYAEAEDGRPVFVLPWREGTLIGTTDLVFDQPPDTAVASEREIEYLVNVVNKVLPDAQLDRSDIGLHYSGVRPLPYSDPAKIAGAITRRHTLISHAGVHPPTYSTVGGKLTTCRSLAEECVQLVLAGLELHPIADSRERPLPGGDNFPTSESELWQRHEEIAKGCQTTVDQVEAVFRLCGTEVGRMLATEGTGPCPNLVNTDLPVDFVRRVIAEEWVTRLADLVERRLMLLYDRRLNRGTLEQLAQLLVEQRKLAADQSEAEVEACCRRLYEHFGRQIES
jgi:glycerol-3-phosphate dehydrogenase